MQQSKMENTDSSEFLSQKKNRSSKFFLQVLVA